MAIINTNIYGLTSQEGCRQVGLRLASVNTFSKDVNHPCVSAQASPKAYASFMVTSLLFQLHASHPQ